MRYKKEFSLYLRKLHSGKGIYYYQTYDERGNRTVAKSTGCTNKTIYSGWS